MSFLVTWELENIFNELVDLTKDLRQDVENANWLLLVANYKILKNMR